MKIVMSSLIRSLTRIQIKLSMIQSILCVSRLLRRDLIFNDYAHVEIEDSNTYGEHPNENFDEYLDNEWIETLDDLDISDDTLKGAEWAADDLIGVDMIDFCM